MTMAPVSLPDVRAFLTNSSMDADRQHYLCSTTVIRMVVVDRYRWARTETFHRDGKQLLGLGDAQVRTGEGQTRPVYRVSVVYSLLMRSLHQTQLYDWARRTLTTIGEACRAVKAETLERIVDWIVDKLTVEQGSIPERKAVLAQHEAGSTVQNFRRDKSVSATLHLRHLRWRWRRARRGCGSGSSRHWRGAGGRASGPARTPETGLPWLPRPYPCWRQSTLPDSTRSATDPPSAATHLQSHPPS